jgi:hypothetical protein
VPLVALSLALEDWNSARLTADFRWLRPRLALSDDTMTNMKPLPIATDTGRDALGTIAVASMEGDGLAAWPARSSAALMRTAASSDLLLAEPPSSWPAASSASAPLPPPSSAPESESEPPASLGLLL